jgi:hypothetical protein
MSDTEPETIGEAIEQLAKGMVSSSSENGRQMTNIPIRDLIEADRHLASKEAAKRPHFGMRMTKCIPPGGG